jgi:hypothetical protein
MLLIVVTGCEPSDPVSLAFGYRPVYSPGDTSIGIEEPRSVKAPGKIYLYGDYLLVNEVSQGIHFFDNEDPSHPIALSFLRIPGNTELAIRNNILYANHMGNIVALTLGEENSVQTLASLELHGDVGGSGILPPKGYYFECINPNRGVVVNWVMTERKNMDCYAIR